MQGQPGRALRAGVMVCFRLEGSMELVSKSRLTMMPQPNHSVFVIVDGAEVEYKVESVRWDLLHANVAEPTGYVLGVPQFDEYVRADIADAGPVVVVSAV